MLAQQSLHCRHLGASSTQARRSIRVSAFGGFLPRLLMQQAGQHTDSKLSRTEVQLQTAGGDLQYPFRVCTFNVLADGLAQSGDFVKVPISCLQWEHRLPLILQEVREANADIICLQELNHFDVLAAALVPEGYSCFFRAKQPSPALKFGFPADGIALFYRHSRFSCSPEPTGHCFASLDGQPAAQGFVTALLRDKLSGRHVLVAATHLKAKAGADNEQTRVHQVAQLLQEVELMQERHMQLQAQQQQQQAPSSSNGSSSSSQAAAVPPAVLLCGDFNTTPDSSTVQALRLHELGLGSIWDVPWAHPTSSHPGNSGSNGAAGAAAAGAAASNGSGGGSGNRGAQPPLNGSNGKHAPAGDGTAVGSNGTGTGAAAAGIAPGPSPAQEGSEFTTWKFRSSGVAKRTIDYIWYSRSQLAPTRRWRMLSEEEIGPEGLPNTRYPSDHMAVTCQFCWVDTQY